VQPLKISIKGDYAMSMLSNNLAIAVFGMVIGILFGIYVCN